VRLQHAENTADELTTMGATEHLDSIARIPEIPNAVELLLRIRFLRRTTPIGGPFYVGLTTFLTGWLPPLNKPALSPADAIVKSYHPAVKRNSFILGGGPPGP
jgi:hypothetical protein